jgi:hypothetical protein
MPGCLKRTDQSIPKEAAKGEKPPRGNWVSSFIHRNKGYCDGGVNSTR